MKKRSRFGRKILTLGILCALSFGGLSGCGKEEATAGVPLWQLTTEYELEGVLKSVYVPADGTTYALTALREGCKIYHFDAQGTCTDTYFLEEYCNVDSIVVTDDQETIYFAGQKNGSMTLFAYHPATAQVEELCNFWYDLVRTKKLVKIGDAIYVMGETKTSYSRGVDGQEYKFSAGETIYCCPLGSGEYEPLGFDYPINIAAGEDGKLIIFAYLPEDGYCLVEYSPQDGSVKQRAKLENCRFCDFAVCNGGKSVLYDCPWSARGLVMADLDDMEMEVEIYDDSISFVMESRVWYGNGRVYLQESGSKKLTSFPLDAVQKKNKEVRLVMAGEGEYVAPYGCGYRLERMVEDWDKIALKVLAQDQDYDLCLAASDYSGGIEMRENKVFYPLNDLPGIEEYLDRCLPYMREAATTEDGMIWMLPFSVRMDALFVDEERMKETGIALHDNMTLKEFVQVVEELSPQEKGLLFFAPEDVSDHFLKQYFGHTRSLTDGEFLGFMEDLRLLHKKEELIWPEGGANLENVICELMPLGYFGNCPSGEMLWNSQEISIYSMPKRQAEDKNYVTIDYFVVNGKSKHRQETMNYLADLIAYLMGQEDLWIFQGNEEAEGSQEAQGRRLFENGEVFFAVDGDVYQKDYVEVLKSDQPLAEYVEEIARRLELYQKE